MGEWIAWTGPIRWPWPPTAEVGIDIGLLGYDANVAPGPARMLCDFDPGDQGAAFGRCQETRQQARRGALAGAIGAEKAEHLTRGHREIHVIHRNAFTESACQAFCPQGRKPWLARGWRWMFWHGWALTEGWLLALKFQIGAAGIARHQLGGVE